MQAPGTPHVGGVSAFGMQLAERKEPRKIEGTVDKLPDLPGKHNTRITLDLTLIPVGIFQMIMALASTINS